MQDNHINPSEINEDVSVGSDISIDTTGVVAVETTETTISKDVLDITLMKTSSLGDVTPEVTI